MGHRPRASPSIHRVARCGFVSLLVLCCACSDPPNKPGPAADPPQLACPPSMTIAGVVGAGQVITYPAATVTGGTPPVVVACNPPSGSTFPLGATTATCNASDALSRQAGCSFTITLT